MKKLLIYLLVLPLWLCSCYPDEDIPSIPPQTEQTVFMYFPWSTNLAPYFLKNIEDFKDAIANKILKNERVIVCFAESPAKAVLFELQYKKGECVADTLKHYQNPAFTTVEGITDVLRDVKSVSPAKRYAMIIGCHGMGWLPVSQTKARGIAPKFHWDYEGVPMTRYFGGTSPEYQTNTTTLAKSIFNAGMKMEYILFDDCYMSSIEVAYDLKDVTDYLIACPTEIMAYGFPYHTLGKYLIGEVDYASICEGFYNFYSNYEDPHGTIGVTNCREVENLASIMKEINRQFTFDPHLVNDIQRMDGYTPILFFDYGDYVAHLCKDSSLLEEFNQQLRLTVPYKAHTEMYYSQMRGKIKINAYSGITVSDPSTNSWASSAKEETGWYRATH